MTERLEHQVIGMPPGSRLSPAAEQLWQKALVSVKDPVDELHVAAVLESMGVNDSTVQSTYGHDNVFSLADAIFHRSASTQPGVGNDPPAADPPAKGERLRMLAHGPIYLMLSPVYPAVLAVLGTTVVFRLMVVMTAVGWIWAMGMSVVAYQLAGRGLAGSAGRALRLGTGAGLAVAALTGTLFALIGHSSPGLIAFAVAQMSFQLMSGVLVFYRRELWLALTMVPACAVGLILLASGSRPALITPTLIAGGISIVLLAAAAWVASVQATAGPDKRQAPAISYLLASTGPSVSYAALCALFFLSSDARFLTGELDEAIAAVPLILGMGALEWCAFRFSRNVRLLLDHPMTSAEYQRAAWRLLMAELTNSLVTVALLGALFMAVLARLGELSKDGAVLVDAYVLLAGVFFLGFVMSRYRQFAPLIALMLAAVAAEFVGTVWLYPQETAPIFLTVTGLLFLSQIVALRAGFRVVYRYQ